MEKPRLAKILSRHNSCYHVSEWFERQYPFLAVYFTKYRNSSSELNLVLQVTPRTAVVSGRPTDSGASYLFGKAGLEVSLVGEETKPGSCQLY